MNFHAKTMFYCGRLRWLNVEARGLARAFTGARHAKPETLHRLPARARPDLPEASLFHARKPPFLVFTGTIFGVSRQPRQGATKKEKPLDAKGGKLMRNYGLLSGEPSPPLDQIREQKQQVMRFQAMEQETTDPLAARLLQDIISEMEAELREQVDRLVAERHERTDQVAK
jgi:hypothetical protein